MRRIGAGALFRDGMGGVLLVKPSYKNHWEIPGGVVEPEETPRACCRRELREELGLEIEVGRLLVVDWLPPDPPRPEGWMFVYDGGVLGAGGTGAIRLPQEELLEWRFVQLDDIDPLVSQFKARRLRMAYQCALDGTTTDLEWGFLPGFDETALNYGESDIKQIREVERRYDLAWNAADPASIGALFTADAIVINPFGHVTTERHNIQREIGELLTGRAKDSTHRSTIERIHFVGADVAIVDGSAVLEGIRGLNTESAMPVEHKFTDVLVRDDDLWLIAEVRAYVLIPEPPGRPS